MEAPRDIDSVLKFLLGDGRGKEHGSSVLAPEDEAYLTKLIAAVRAGKRAVLVVEDNDEKLKYMFSNATRPEAMSMLGKVIEATGRRLASGDE